MDIEYLSSMEGMERLGKARRRQLAILSYSDQRSTGNNRMIKRASFRKKSKLYDKRMAIDSPLCSCRWGSCIQSRRRPRRGDSKAPQLPAKVLVRRRLELHPVLNILSPKHPAYQLSVMINIELLLDNGFHTSQWLMLQVPIQYVIYVPLSDRIGQFSRQIGHSSSKQT